MLHIQYSKDWVTTTFLQATRRAPNWLPVSNFNPFSTVQIFLQCKFDLVIFCWKLIGLGWSSNSLFWLIEPFIHPLLIEHILYTTLGLTLCPNHLSLLPAHNTNSSHGKVYLFPELSDCEISPPALLRLWIECPLEGDRHSSSVTPDQMIMYCHWIWLYLHGEDHSNLPESRLLHFTYPVSGPFFYPL